MSIDTNVETPAQENTRLNREQKERMALVDARVAALQDEGFGDGLYGALSVLLDARRPYTEEERAEAIVTVVLGMVANRDIARNA